MPQENETLDDVVTVFPLQSILKKKNSNEKNKNYEEFQSVYGGRYNEEGGERCADLQRRNSFVRPKINLKTITMDMPGLGSERAILQPRKITVLKTSKLKPKLEVEKKVVVILPKPNIVQQLTELEKPLEEKPSLEIKKTPSSFLERTNMELNIAAEQLEHIRSLIKIKETATPKKAKTPKHKSKKNSHHHKDCLKKNYMATLSTVQRKLQNLEDKYFAKPSITYRNVNDTFTQYTDVETLYESKNLQEETEVNDKLKDIIQELDELVSRDEEIHRDYPPRDDADDYKAGAKEVIIDTEATDQLLLEEAHNDDTLLEVEDIGSKLADRDTPRLFPFNNDYSVDDNIKTNKGDSWYPRQRLSFKKPEYSVPKDALSRLIDVSESRLKPFRRTKRDIIDVGAICDRICDLSNEDDSDMRGQSETDMTGLFDGTELQQNVSRSCYLTKEFGSVKVFTEEKPLAVESDSSKSLTNLIQYLNMTLKR